MKNKITSFSLFLYLLFLAGCATFTQSGEWYRMSIDDIHQDRPYFAILNLKNILKEYPESPYAPKAAFAIGEYYFDNGDYYNAINVLSNYIRRYPDDKGVVFAKLIVYKIITNFKKEDVANAQQDVLIREIRRELFSEPLFLIFYDKKSPRSYQSIFSNSYLVYDYIDKIKVFRNDKDFIELTP
ncbi:MAG: outer membrane protein assembly factor BamD [Candidatus Omnitrophota bacterium]